MKNILCALSLLICTVTFGQYAISKNDAGRLSEFEKERFAKFKSTTTVFILSNIYNKEDYEKLLKETWKVTPFIVVSVNDFDYMDYLDDKYSFAHLETSVVQQSKGFTIDSFISFYYLDNATIISKLNKVNKAKHKQDKLIELIKDNRRGVGRIGLFYNTELIKLVDKNNGSGGGFSVVYMDPTFYTYSKKTNDEKLNDYKTALIDLVYEKNSFNNYSLGYLKNYFQIINNYLTKEEFIWMFDLGKKSDLKLLKSATLYIPEEIKTEYSPRKIKDSEVSEEDLNKTMSAYKYKYAFISKDDLDAKILNNEDFLYMRFGKINAGFFIQIVNGKTGEVFYQDYTPFRYNINEKAFKQLMTSIGS